MKSIALTEPIQIDKKLILLVENCAGDEFGIECQKLVDPLLRLRVNRIMQEMDARPIC